MSETDQLFQCHVNWMSQLLNGLTTKHYWLVPFQINFILVEVFLTGCQLNKIGNILLSIIMVDTMILYSLLMVSINCCMHVAFKTWLELPEKPGYFEKSLCVGQFRGISKTTNLGKRSPPLPRGKVSQCKGLLNSSNGGIHDSIQSFWTCSNPSKIECCAILLWCWLKLHYWYAPWVWRFADVKTLYETKIQWSKMCNIETRFPIKNAMKLPYVCAWQSNGHFWKLKISIINCKIYLKQSLDAKPHWKHIEVMITFNMINMHIIELQPSMVW